MVMATRRRWRVSAINSSCLMATASVGFASITGGTERPGDAGTSPREVDDVLDEEPAVGLSTTEAVASSAEGAAG